MKATKPHKQKLRTRPIRSLAIPDVSAVERSDREFNDLFQSLHAMIRLFSRLLFALM
jgi:hypothetical protein